MTTFGSSAFATSAVAATLLALTALPANAWNARDGLDRSFDVINKSNRTIVSVYATDIDHAERFNNDLLGDRVVRSGRRINNLVPMNDQGYCRFNLWIQFDNGDLQDISDVNLCEAWKVETYGYDRHRGFVHRISY
jgi:hypothetical protein